MTGADVSSVSLLRCSVIDAVAPDALVFIRGKGAGHAGHRRRAASRVEAHRAQ